MYLCGVFQRYTFAIILLLKMLTFVTERESYSTNKRERICPPTNALDSIQR